MIHADTRRRLRLPILCLLVAVAAEAVAQERTGAIHQLRIYEIYDDTKAAFHDRFRDHARRIMARYDFDIVAMWETKANGRTEFVYLLEWPDEATMKSAWAGFMADEEWAEIKRRTGVRGPLVGDIEDRTLRPVDYSPRRALAR